MIPAPSPRARALPRVVAAVLAGLGLLLAGLAVAPAASAAGGGIKGVVSGPDGPLEGIEVAAYVPDGDGFWDAVAIESTDANGAYTITDLEAGKYRLEFYDPDSYVMEYWNDKFSLNAATPITVGSTMVTGKNATLGLPSTMTGTVVDTAGAGLPNILVTAYLFDPLNDVWAADLTAITDADGYYEIAGLGHGDYRLGFKPYAKPQLGQYLVEYWDDAATLESAANIPVPVGGTVDDLSPILASAPMSSGSITGTVTGVGGPLSGATVTAYGLDAATSTWVPRAHTTTGAAGTYALSGLLPASYRLGFDHGDHVAEFWDDQATLAAANPVTVTAGGTVSGISPQLAGAPITSTTSPTLTGLVDGKAAVGGTLTADPGAWKPVSGGAFSYAYEWFAGATSVQNGAANTYTPATADIGKQIRVRVTATRGTEPSGTADSAPTPAVEQLVVRNLTAPSFTGATQVHSTLTATPGTWDPATVTPTYRWLVGGTPVTGATSPTFTLRPGDDGKNVTVEVTASAPLHTPATRASTARGPVTLAPLTASVDPSISGWPAVGSVLTADPGTWSATAGVTHAYQWYVGDRLVDGATQQTYTPVDADRDQAVSVLVTASGPGYVTASKRSAPTSDVTLPRLGNDAAPTLTGAPSVGGTLTATTGSWTPSDVSYAYEWTVGDVVIDHDAATYSPTAADVGKTVMVTVTATRSGFAPTAASSQRTAAVYQPTANTYAPRVTGTPQVGQRLTAAAGTWSPSGLTYRYQWLVGGKPVTGQTATTFLVPATALNLPVAVVVTASGSGPAVTTTSPATAKIKAGVLRAVRAPAVTGIAKVGKTLRGSAGTVSPAATKATYQWLRNGKAIRGATKATYKLTAADRGRKVSLKVTYVRAGYAKLTKTSKAVTVR